MLTYNMDVREDSRWLRTTPGDTAIAQPYYCTEVGLFYGNAHFSTARTSKNSYLVFYTFEGAGLIEQYGTQVVLSKGQALLLNCRSPQSYCTDPAAGQWHHLWAHVNGVGVAAIESILNPSRITPITIPELSAREPFEILLGSIERVNTASIIEQSMAIHTLLTSMAKRSLGDATAASNQAMVRRAAEHIRAHYMEPLTLDRIVADACVSKAYFLRLFRRYVGTTPYNYLLCCRITHAKELLVTTDIPIGIIAQQVGFYNESNFSTRFSSMTGQNPTMYRSSSRTK